MIWLPFLALAAAAFLLAAFVLKLPRSAYTLLGATLLFGLAGYAIQGRPGLPGAPGRASAGSSEAGELLVEERRRFFGSTSLPSRAMITSDAFARRGDYANAAGFARAATQDNPADIEAWTALGNALVEHAEGRLTPAAAYAYEEGGRRAPGQAAPGYFLGLTLLRAGEPGQARAIWAEQLAMAPADAEWRPLLAERLARLDALLTQNPAQP